MRRLYRIGKNKYVSTTYAKIRTARDNIGRDDIYDTICMNCDNHQDFDSTGKVDVILCDSYGPSIDSYVIVAKGVHIKCDYCKSSVYYKKTFPRWRWRS